MTEFKYEPIFSPGPDRTEYQLIGDRDVRILNLGGRTFIEIGREALISLAREAMRQVNFYLRPSHNRLVSEILLDPEASDNDRYVARAMLKNAIISVKASFLSARIPGR